MLETTNIKTLQNLSDQELEDIALLGYVLMGAPNYMPSWSKPGAKIYDFDLVLEGGGFRGQFSAGVLDFFADNGIFPSRVIGVSAGALTGSCFVAGMRGRSSYLNVKYCNYWRYFSIKSLLLKGNAFDVDFAWGSMMYESDPYDFEAFRASPIKLVSVASNLETGRADYHSYNDIEKEIDYLRASASVPLITRVVHIDGKLLLDGGVCDSVPIEYSLETGPAKRIVVLTQAADFVKQQAKPLWPSRLMYKKSPNFVQAFVDRHLEYNRVYEKVAQMHADGKICLLRPPNKVEVSQMERSKYKNLALYFTGYQEAKKQIEKIRSYIG